MIEWLLSGRLWWVRVGLISLPVVAAVLWAWGAAFHDPRVFVGGEEYPERFGLNCAGVAAGHVELVFHDGVWAGRSVNTVFEISGGRGVVPTRMVVRAVGGEWGAEWVAKEWDDGRFFPSNMVCSWWWGDVPPGVLNWVYRAGGPSNGEWVNADPWYWWILMVPGAAALGLFFWQRSVLRPVFGVLVLGICGMSCLGAADPPVGWPAAFLAGVSVAGEGAGGGVVAWDGVSAYGGVLDNGVGVAVATGSPVVVTVVPVAASVETSHWAYNGVGQPLQVTAWSGPDVDAGSSIWVAGLERVSVRVAWGWRSWFLAGFGLAVMVDAVALSCWWGTRVVTRVFLPPVS